MSAYNDKKNKEDKIFNLFENKKDDFKKDILCIIFDLNRIYARNVEIDNFTEIELFELFLYKQRLETNNQIRFLSSLIDVKLLITNFAISLLTIVISLNIFQAKVIPNILILLIVLIIIYIVITFIAFIFWKLLYKSVVLDKNGINEHHVIISNIEFIDKIITMKYLAKES